MLGGQTGGQTLLKLSAFIKSEFELKMGGLIRWSEVKDTLLFGYALINY